MNNRQLGGGMGIDIPERQAKLQECKVNKPAYRWQEAQESIDFTLAYDSQSENY
jgi:hypothetical protein